MKRLVIAVIALFFIAGTTFWLLGADSEPDPETAQRMKLMSRFKDAMKEAETGDAQAQFRVAQMLEEGDGTGMDVREAAKWYLRAADQGFAEARYKVGLMHVQGDGLRQDFAEAAKWFRLASTFDHHPKAQYRLGELYFNGRGVEHDYGKAIQYFKLAASKGHPAAQFVLGSMYIEGWGVERDLMAAYVWLKLSAEKREEALKDNARYDAVKKLKTLVKKMNNFQMERSEKLLVDVRREVERNIAKNATR